MELTKEQKRIYQISFNRLIFSSMNEVMHSTYLESSAVKNWDSNLALKLRNIKGQLANELKKDYQIIESLGGLEAIQLFYKLTNIFERIIETAQIGNPREFENLILILEAYQKGEIRIED
ncbi:MAG TPA: hypothetical protein VIH28_08245 [Ignavibacteriaceae bacterium]